MIEKLVFKFGSSKTSKPLEIKPGFMNVLVGPNNSGKSRTLWELGKYYEANVEKPEYNKVNSLLSLGGSSTLFGSQEKKILKTERDPNNFKILSEIELRIPRQGEFRTKLKDILILDVESLKGEGEWSNEFGIYFIKGLLQKSVFDFFSKKLIEEHKNLIEYKKDIPQEDKIKIESELVDSLKILEKRSEKIIAKSMGLISNIEKFDIWKLLDSFIKIFNTSDLKEIKFFYEAIKEKFSKPLNSNDSETVQEILGIVLGGNFVEENGDRLFEKINTLIGRELKVFEKPLDEYIALFIEKTMIFFDFVESKNALELLDILLDSQVLKLSSYDSLCKEYILSIDGENRFQFVRDRKLESFSNVPSNDNHFMKFLHPSGKNRIEEFRKVIKDFFGFYPVFDLRNNSEIKLTFSKKHPEKHELGRDFEESQEFLEKNTIPISEFSHGMRATTGILSKVISSEYNMLLLDEPDAFLHPPLAKRLGKYLTNYTSDQDGNTFVATHSSDFLMGCIDSGNDVNIIRLTHSEDDSTIRSIDFKELKILMSDPLLRSTQFLNSLFYQGVVICEADADRVFYNEIYQKLLNANSKECIDSIVFLNAQNKPTVRRIVNPLRKMGIPAVAIVDMDIISIGEGANLNDFPDLLDSCFITNEDKEELIKLRLELFGFFKTIKKEEQSTNEYLKEYGLSEFEESKRVYFLNNFFYRLNEYGIFIVDVGELECWLKELNLPKKKKTWIVKVMERLEDISPAQNDVWNFITRMNQWIIDPNRKGIPT